MKKALKFLSWMFILLLTVSVSSCKDDDDDASADAGTNIEGVYSGVVRVMGYTDEERAFVTVTRLSADAVRVEIECEGLSIDTSNIMDVSVGVGGYSLSVEGKAVTGQIGGNVLNMTFSIGSYTFNFVGSKG